MKSLQSKIIFLIIFIMLVTGGTINLISNKEIGDAMLNQQNMLSQHVLSLIELNIKGGYHNLIIDKIDSVSRHKQMLKNRMELIVSMIDNHHANSREHNLPEDSSKQVVLKWIKASGQGSHVRSFIADKDLMVIAHPDPTLMGAFIGDFTDMKHKTLAETSDTIIANPDPTIRVINWQAPGGGKKAKYLVCIQYYAPWNWLLGTVVNIDDIEIEAKQQLDKIVETLGESFEEIHIDQTGFAFLFDKQFNVLAISDNSISSGFKQAVNLDTGNLVFEDMIHSSSNKDGFLSYETGLFSSGKMIAYVSYFKPLGWYIGVTVPESEIKQPAKDIASKQTLYIGLILSCAILLTAWLVSKISKPLNILAGRVKAFSKTDLTSGEEDDPYIKSLMHHKDEVGRLADAFVLMKKQLKDNIRQLIETTAENERIEGELNIAKDIQLGILPKVFPPFPDRREIDIYASLEPAKEVGGDLYDFYFIDENKLCFTIGDVSGKGVPAALMMAITKTLIKNAASKHIGPADIMIEVNEAIAGDNPQSMFVTLFVGIIDLETGKIAYANGGHNPPVYISGASEPAYVKNTSGPMVGIMEDIPYKEYSLTLAPGEALFMYTDGVTEAQNPSKAFYSDARLLEKIKSQGTASSEALILTLKSDINDFAGTEPQFDDIAMLMIKFKEAK
ncbi:MAG: SpoIIE family protein phosphatase [Desulfobacterales bacterium]|nr:SpoIIE family protein phosphatase [Desulfobacterales bacterium]